MISLWLVAYPYGYGDEDIITFKNLKGESIEAVEVRTENSIYLVKISNSLANFIFNFDDDKEQHNIPDFPLHQHYLPLPEMLGSGEE
ncbi:hypothetical protein [Arenibacter certesii]|uniref:Uncharacterized protein n=1 Tax=Arenibacter certesii TaxID=228955 RepID=A0A918MJ06_9FLAO|nr:hypothetical protein [Arenibacter certesii]GGW25786.1 hypothetical protein GCM10007383_08270 [Arenibacter certesii]